MSLLPLSSPQSDGRAFSEAAAALSPDVPLLLFGSGDVNPSHQDANTVALVAELTVQYMARLVDAAVDAHDVLTDGAGGILPPPPVPHKRVPPKPAPPEPITTTKPLLLSAKQQPPKRRRKRANVEYWDEPLPEPKIRTKFTTEPSSPQNTTPQATDPTDTVHVDEWVGVAGVDFWETAKRRVHVSTPAAIGTQCFIFPVCHDAGLYGRVMEVQAARRTIEPVLLDPGVMDLVRTEGKRFLKARSTSTVTNANQEDDDDDDDENQDQENLAVWPGLESLLPIHRGDNV